MIQQRRSTGPRIQKVSQKRDSAPDSTTGVLRRPGGVSAITEDATTIRRAEPDSEPRTLIARESSGAERDACDSEPRTLIAKPLSESESEPPKSANDEGPATVLWTRSSIEVRVRGQLTPPSGTAIPAPEAFSVARKSPPSFRPKPAPIARVSTPHVGLTPMQKLQMQQAQQAQMQPAPMSQQSMSQQPMSQQTMSQQPMSQQPMSRMQAPMAPTGSIAPVMVDPSTSNMSFAPMAGQVAAHQSSELGSTIAKLAAVLVFAAIGLFILRGSVGGSTSVVAAEPPAAQQVLATQPISPPSSWVAPQIVVPPPIVTDPRAPAPQTVGTIAPQSAAVAPVVKKTTKKRADPAAAQPAPPPAPIDLPGEMPDAPQAAPTQAAPTPVTAPQPAPVTAPAPTMKTMPTKTSTPSKNEGDAAQKTLDQAKFETTDSL